LTTAPQSNAVTAEPLGGRAEHVGKPGVAQMTQPELQRVGAEPVRELVHVRFPGEVVRGRGQGAVRALRQR